MTEAISIEQLFVPGGDSSRGSMSMCLKTFFFTRNAFNTQRSGSKQCCQKCLDNVDGVTGKGCEEGEQLKMRGGKRKLLELFL